MNVVIYKKYLQHKAPAIQRQFLQTLVPPQGSARHHEMGVRGGDGGGGEVGVGEGAVGEGEEQGQVARDLDMEIFICD